jgi:EmrB/QacA subfamily drug resistance transporter
MTLPAPVRRNLLLLVVCLAQLMVILDVSIVNVALPSIRNDLGYSTTGLQWVVNAYTLTFAGFLLLGGRAADLLGRRRVFLAGTALFTLASVLCAVAGSQGTLDVARALQGFGAAVISPATLAILTTSFAEGRERNRALAAWGAMGGLGGATGVLLGGVLTQELGWPAIFVINVPIGLALIAMSLRVVPEGRTELARRHFDVAGAVLVTAGLTALVYGIVRTDVLSWGSLGVLIPLAVGVALIAAFALVEGRFARAPLMPARLVRLGRLRAANLVIFLLFSAIFVMWFFVSLYLQQVLGLDALQTGLAFLPMTLGIVLVTSQTAKLIARFGPGRVLAGGMVVAGAGMALLSDVHAGGSYLADVLPGGVLAAVGLGLGLVSGTVVAVQGVEPRDSGLASGLLNTSRLIGGALGLAVLSTLAAAQTNDELAGGTAHAVALSDGFQAGFLAGAGACAVGALVAALLLGRSPATAPAAAGEVESAAG